MNELPPERLRRARVALIVASILVSLCVAEVALRVARLGPWAPFEALEHAPTMTRPDDALGWAPVPGVYRWKPDPQADAVRLTLGADGGRGEAGKASVLLFGGSFMLGFGVDDGEDVGAVLARELPGESVRNFGVPGYGTLQARRHYERVIDQADPGATILYGLNELHDARNACTRSWLHALDRAGAHHPWVQCPWAAFNGQAVVEHAPRRYAHLRASEVSALVHLLELASIDLRDRFLRTKTETTIRLVAGWRDRVESAGGRFKVALLWAPTREDAYLRRLSELGVSLVDLRGAGFPAVDGSAIPVDGHPSAQTHERWGVRLGAVLREGS